MNSMVVLYTCSALGSRRRHKGNGVLLRNASLRLALALLLHPRRGLLQRRLGQKVHYRSRDRALELNIAGVEHPGAARLGGMVLQMPMSGHIIKVRHFVVVESPGYRVMRGRVDVIAVVLILKGMETDEQHARHEVEVSPPR